MQSEPEHARRFPWGLAAIALLASLVITGIVVAVLYLLQNR